MAFTSGVSANKVCFDRELLDHYRLVFETQGTASDGIGEQEANSCTMGTRPADNAATTVTSAQARTV